MTQNEAVTWLQSQVGQYLDFDHAFGLQCFDLFNFYYQYLTKTNPYAFGYGIAAAKDIYDVPSDTFLKLPDTASLMAFPGDILIYGSSWGAGYGHVETVESVDDNGCHIIGENENASATAPVTRVYRTWAQMHGLKGILRFKWESGGEMVNQEVLELSYKAAFGRMPDEAAMSRIGQSVDVELTDLLQSAEYAERQAKVEAFDGLNQSSLEKDGIIAELKKENGDLKATLNPTPIKSEPTTNPVQEPVSPPPPPELVPTVQPTPQPSTPVKQSWLERLIELIINYFKQGTKK